MIRSKNTPTFNQRSKLLGQIPDPQSLIRTGRKNQLTPLRLNQRQNSTFMPHELIQQLRSLIVPKTHLILGKSMRRKQGLRIIIPLHSTDLRHGRDGFYQISLVRIMDQKSHVSRPTPTSQNWTVPGTPFDRPDGRSVLRNGQRRTFDVSKVPNIY